MIEVYSMPTLFFVSALLHVLWQPLPSAQLPIPIIIIITNNYDAVPLVMIHRMIMVEQMVRMTHDSIDMASNDD